MECELRLRDKLWRRKRRIKSKQQFILRNLHRLRLCQLQRERRLKHGRYGSPTERKLTKVNRRCRQKDNLAIARKHSADMFQCSDQASESNRTQGIDFRAQSSEQPVQCLGGDFLEGRLLKVSPPL